MQYLFQTNSMGGSQQTQNVNNFGLSLNQTTPTNLPQSSFTLNNNGNSANFSNESVSPNVLGMNNYNNNNNVNNLGFGLNMNQFSTTANANSNNINNMNAFMTIQKPAKSNDDLL